MSRAYGYADPDRTLNVVVLSDGMTEQSERAELMALLRARPGNARVFCVGVGNEVERGLLDRVATSAGGFAAFLSSQDDFARQARAFRRKVTRPAATSLVLALPGANVYDIEPEQLPDLYHGQPLRIYGRFKGQPPIGAKLGASVLGRSVMFESTFDPSNAKHEQPMIERMWAWHRIRALKPLAKERGSIRAVNEIVRLGEGYSIASEWTSFLVLEADAEYDRWKIERRNALRVGREREQQERLRERFAALREKADASIGPAAVERIAQRDTRTRQSAAVPVTADPPRRRRSSSSGGGWSWGGGGGGAIDPWTALIALALGAFIVIGRVRR